MFELLVGGFLRLRLVFHLKIFRKFQKILSGKRHKEENFLGLSRAYRLAHARGRGRAGRSGWYGRRAHRYVVRLAAWCT